jgi:uncharacterized protein YxjI
MTKSIDEFQQHLRNAQRLHIQQVYENFEILLGWESRNKYRILDQENLPVAYAAEEKSGLGGVLLRQILGHKRPFKIHIYNEAREKMYELEFPFRWFFKTLYLRDHTGKHLGHLQERWAIFRKKFDIYDAQNRVIGEINTPFFKVWTFDVHSSHKKLGTIQKKWAGILGEFFTDKDNYLISYADPNLPLEAKSLMLAMGLMIDIVYFENNQGKGSVLGIFD